MDRLSALVGLVAATALPALAIAADPRALQQCLQTRLETLYPPATGVHSDVAYLPDTSSSGVTRALLRRAPRSGRDEGLVTIGIFGPSPASLAEALADAAERMAGWPDADKQRDTLWANYNVVYFSSTGREVELVNKAAEAGFALRVESMGTCETPPPLSECSEDLPVVFQPDGPIYPRRCVQRARSLTGSVVVRYTVTATGRTTNATVLRSTSSLFDRSAVEFIAQRVLETPSEPCYQDHTVIYGLDD